MLCSWIRRSSGEQADEVALKKKKEPGALVLQDVLQHTARLQLLLHDFRVKNEKQNVFCMFVENSFSGEIWPELTQGYL